MLFLRHYCSAVADADAAAAFVPRGRGDSSVALHFAPLPAVAKPAPPFLYPRPSPFPSSHSLFPKIRPPSPELTWPIE